MSSRVVGESAVAIPVNYNLTTPSSHSSLELITDFLVFVSRDEALPAIYPGQPFTIQWQYAGVLAQIRSNAKVVARVLSKNKASTIATSSPTYVSGGVSEQINDITATDSSVYRI